MDGDLYRRAAVELRALTPELGAAAAAARATFRRSMIAVVVVIVIVVGVW
jgi:hypothetical protein